MPRPAQTSAFTLIELLVVVTIIVVLLALLTPALDKAIYQAELAVCASHLKGIATGSQAYAFSSRRAYPYRRIVQQNGAYWTNQLTNNNFDDRLVIRDYIAINALLNDPLSKAVNKENYQKDAATRPSWTFSAYDLWFGWKYSGLRGMFRVGDRFEWVEASSTGTVSYRFDLLACDVDWQTPDALNAIAGHADQEPWVMHNRVMDNQPYDANTESASFASSAGTLIAWSWWDVRGGRRGTLDRNFVHEDGSVLRITGVDLDDGRFVRTSYTLNGGSGAAWKVQLPEH